MSERPTAPDKLIVITADQLSLLRSVDALDVDRLCSVAKAHGIGDPVSAIWTVEDNGDLCIAERPLPAQQPEPGADR